MKLYGKIKGHYSYDMKARVIILVHDTSSHRFISEPSFTEISLTFSSYRVDMKLYGKYSKGNYSKDMQARVMVL